MKQDPPPPPTLVVQKLPMNLLESLSLLFTGGTDMVSLAFEENLALLKVLFEAPTKDSLLITLRILVETSGRSTLQKIKICVWGDFRVEICCNQWRMGRTVTKVGGPTKH